MDDVVYMAEIKEGDESGDLVRLSLSALTREVVTKVPEFGVSCQKIGDTSLLFPLVGVFDLQSGSWRKFEDGWTVEAFVPAVGAVLLKNWKEQRAGFWDVTALTPLTCSMKPDELFVEFGHKCLESNMASTLLTRTWAKDPRPMLEREGGTLSLRGWRLTRDMDDIQCVLTGEGATLLAREMHLRAVVVDGDGDDWTRGAHTWCGSYTLPLDRHSGMCYTFVVTCEFSNLATWWHNDHYDKSAWLYGNKLLSQNEHHQISVFDPLEKTMGPWLTFSQV